ncbi:LOW QUALITY PROTEIN: hypothetical protein HID58_059441 [Brassica napus]|uniref:Exocyst subunit Exo70 family protein n=2 Tax=Brassica TaxID=3705 RepID=A0ABQ7ZTT7_BRANA|nr:LOW QUALITY PROTEIN: hypothetical protein HID58_059441 [Brassica napus]
MSTTKKSPNHTRILCHVITSFISRLIVKCTLRRLLSLSILLPANLQQCPSPSITPSTPLFSPSPSTAFSFGFSFGRTRLRCLRLVTSCVASVQSTIANGSAPAPVVVEREQIRLGLPIKGRMAADAIDLLKVCQLFVKQVNPRQEVKKYREVMRRLRDCARATFLEFKSAIASDVSSHPFPGGAVHPLTNYVMNYLMALTDFSQTLGSLLMEHEDVEDLTIPPSPPDAINPEEEEFTYDSPEKFVAMKRHFCSIASVLEANLQMKSKLYRDVSLRHIFLLNNIHYMTRKSCIHLRLISRVLVAFLRKCFWPLFPGKNLVHQLDLMTDFVGTPPPESISRKNTVPFSHKFPKADPLALRLLERLLAFDPKDRASAEDALSDPYFSGLSNSERETSTQPISKLEFDFERKKLTKDDVRELIYREMLEEFKRGGDQLSFMYPKLASIFIEHILFK